MIKNVLNIVVIIFLTLLFGCVIHRSNLEDKSIGSFSTNDLDSCEIITDSIKLKLLIRNPTEKKSIKVDSAYQHLFYLVSRLGEDCLYKKYAMRKFGNDLNTSPGILKLKTEIFNSIKSINDFDVNYIPAYSTSTLLDLCNYYNLQEFRDTILNKSNKAISNFKLNVDTTIFISCKNTSQITFINQIIDPDTIGDIGVRNYILNVNPSLLQNVLPINYRFFNADFKNLQFFKYKNQQLGILILQDFGFENSKHILTLWKINKHQINYFSTLNKYIIEAFGSAWIDKVNCYNDEIIVILRSSGGDEGYSWGQLIILKVDYPKSFKIIKQYSCGADENGEGILNYDFDTLKRVISVKKTYKPFKANSPIVNDSVYPNIYLNLIKK